MLIGSNLGLLLIISQYNVVIMKVTGHKWLHSRPRLSDIVTPIIIRKIKSARIYQRGLTSQVLLGAQLFCGTEYRIIILYFAGILR